MNLERYESRGEDVRGKSERKRERVMVGVEPGTKVVGEMDGLDKKEDVREIRERAEREKGQRRLRPRRERIRGYDRAE